ncbi:hypothetical protein FEK31_12585 [Nocardia cyriacigeorgica]|nr:hypothetical protein FEK31_12585 [Nocardia cyriacigeorgica]
MTIPTRIKFHYTPVDERAGDRELPLLSVSSRLGVVRRDSIVDGPSRAEDLRNYKVCARGDIVLNRMSAYHGAVGQSVESGLVSPDYLVIRTGKSLDSRFAHHLFRSHWFVGEMTSRLRGIGSSDNGGVRTPRINAEDLGDILVKLPELDEQRRIADFLDAETSRIGTIESARKRQMALLEESELATIGAMLGGRTEASRRRKTGWKWLPEIPEGWAIGPVYAYYDTELGKMLNAERAAGRNQRPYLRNANVGWYRISLNDVATMDFSPEEVLRYSLRSGDLLVCEGGAGVAEAAVWDGSIEECYFQKSLHRVRSRTNLPVEWLMYWLRYAKSCGVFEATGNVATIPHLTGEQLRRFRIPVPENSNDAIRITRDSIARSASLRELLAGMLDILSERRQALITAAVTGQFDVSTASGRNTTQGV